MPEFSRHQSLTQTLNSIYLFLPSLIRRLLRQSVPILYLIQVMSKRFYVVFSLREIFIPRIFKTKATVNRYLKQNQNLDFKQFNSEEDAEYFSKNIEQKIKIRFREVPSQTTRGIKAEQTPHKVQNKVNPTEKSKQVKNVEASIESTKETEQAQKITKDAKIQKEEPQEPQMMESKEQNEDSLPHQEEEWISQEQSEIIEQKEVLKKYISKNDLLDQIFHGINKIENKYENQQAARIDKQLSFHNLTAQQKETILSEPEDKEQDKEQNVISTFEKSRNDSIKVVQTKKEELQRQVEAQLPAETFPDKKQQTVKPEILQKQQRQKEQASQEALMPSQKEPEHQDNQDINVGETEQQSSKGTPPKQCTNQKQYFLDSYQPIKIQSSFSNFNSQEADLGLPFINLYGIHLQSKLYKHQYRNYSLNEKQANLTITLRQHQNPGLSVAQYNLQTKSGNIRKLELLGVRTKVEAEVLSLRKGFELASQHNVQELTINSGLSTSDTAKYKASIDRRLRQMMSPVSSMEKTFRRVDYI